MCNDESQQSDAQINNHVTAQDLIPNLTKSDDL